MLNIMCIRILQMLLAGQRPETVVEICSRALSFWTYQVLISDTPSPAALTPHSLPDPTQTP